jgi:CRP-like cAMP-binding protein
VKTCEACASANVCAPYRLGLVQADEPALARAEDRYKRGEIIVSEGATPDMLVIREGWAAKYQLFGDGRRQIVDILLPGEFVTCGEIASPRASASVLALSEVEVCRFDRDPFMAKVGRDPPLLMDLWRNCALQVRRLRDLVSALGRQSAEARLAALILSLHARLIALGRASESEMPFPFRQQDLADVLGLTQVHVGRTLKLLKERRAAETTGDTLTLLSLPALQKLALS